MGPSAQTRKTRFLIISDTHNQELFPATDSKHAFRNPLPECDVLLHCGDLTMTGELVEYKSQIRLMSSIQAELKLVIAGNHDLSLDKEWWDNNPTDWKRRKPSHPDDDDDEHEAARELWTGEVARAAGITFLDEGLHSFTLSSGAKFTVYASPYQPDFYNWAFKYGANDDRFNPAASIPAAPRGTVNIAQKPVPDWPQVDIMMTHGPPYHVLDTTIHGNNDVGCPHLLRAVTRARPRIHAFGHIHEGWGAEVGKWKRQSSKSSTTDPNRPFEGSEMVIIDHIKALKDRAVHLDLTEGWDKQVFGNSTLFVNAAIMTASNPYRPENAPFLVDIELAVG